jgi:FtsH-binding integral membrane protein
MNENISGTTALASHATPLWRRGLYAGVGALIANSVVLYFTKPLAPDLMALSPVPVTFWTVMGTMGATLVYALVRRRSRAPERTYLIVAIVVLLISFIPDWWVWETKPPMFKGVTLGGIFALMAMHVVAAVIITGVLLRTTRPVPLRG